MAWRMHSTAFAAGVEIPPDYACDGAGHSPPLAWEPPPSGARSLALVVDDPDASDGTVVHWVLFNLPIERRHLDAGIPTDTEPVQKPMLRAEQD